MSSTKEELDSILGDLLEPWFTSLKDPGKSQQDTLAKLLQGYRATEYGKRYSAQKINSLGEFGSAFPIVNYNDLLPEFAKIRNGNYISLFPEPVSKWVMTRGSTGEPKLIPTTESFLSEIFSCGARAIVNFALKKDPKVLDSKVLNLNFPSEVNSMPSEAGEESTKYGYSSGTYAKLFPSLDNTGLVPLQEDIDSLGGSISKHDWEARFDLVYNRAKDCNVGSVMGVTPVIESFARYVKKKYSKYPKQIWKMRALFLTSVAKIHTRHAPMLQHYFGEVPVVEMYTATEGVFGQQLDDIPYFVPNYDTYVFEVKMRGGVKLLPDLRPHEWGSLVISSVLFPRYEIGDLVESLGHNYFRIFGRKKKRTVMEHIAYNLFTMSF